MAGRVTVKNRNGKLVLLTLVVTFVGVWSLFQISELKQSRNCKCDSNQAAQEAEADTAASLPVANFAQPPKPYDLYANAAPKLPQQQIGADAEASKPAQVHTNSDVLAPPLLSNATLVEMLSQHILLEPPWVQAMDWGLVEDSTFNLRTLKGTSADQETEFSWKTFFHGMTRGLFLELGGMNGRDYSASLPYETQVGWRSILIEGSMDDAQQIPLNRPSSLSLQLVVCQQPSTVHFVHAAWGVGGILEFMAPDFLWEFHRPLLKDSVLEKPGNNENVSDLLDWEKVKRSKNVFEQQCLPLQYVFDRYGIRHINFMVLDLEGGELGALKSLDFNRIRFDVMCVETNRMQNPKDPYIAEVIGYLTSKGYILFQSETIGKNSWFVHPSWTRFNST